MAEPTAIEATALAPPTWADGTKLTETFKIANGVNIKADVILPPGLKPGKHPLIIAWHGGGLVAGSRDFAMFMSSWLPSWAAELSAIFISADYRLLPSATAADVREDVESLWSWVHESLPSVLASRAPEHTVDLSRIIVSGGSAGGFCASHMAMSHYASIKSLVLVYPMVDFHSDYWQHGVPESEDASYAFGPVWRGDVLKQKIEEGKKEGVVTSRISPMGQISLGNSMIRSGKVTDFFTDVQDSPVERIRSDKSANLPPRVWLLHGTGDHMVPVDGSRVLAETIKKTGWKTDLIFDEISQGVTQHGFDATWTLKDEKLKKRLDWISEVL